MRNRIGWILIVLAFGTFSARAENWPQFRGPTGQGHSSEAGLPLNWSTNSNVLWKTAIPGESWSSPIVWGDRVFLTTATEKGTSCHVLCVDRSTGNVLWNKGVLQQVTTRKEGRNTFATPTPATDGRRIYAAFHDGSFVALNVDGSVAWTNRELPHYSHHGLGTSPILFENLLIMARDLTDAEGDKLLGWQKPWDKSFVVALEAATGKLRWKTGRGLSRIGHVVPCLWTAPDGQVQVVSGAGDVVQGFDAKTGERIWTSENKGEGVVPSLVVGDGLVFSASGWSGREATAAFRLGGKGDLKETNLAWQQAKDMPHIPSFLYVSPHLYSISEAGTLLCLKGDSGAIVWSERLNIPHSASPVYADGRIYVLSDSGITTVIEAGAAFKLLARNPLGEKCQASMAVSGQRLFIRGEKHLYCIGNP